MANGTVICASLRAKLAPVMRADSSNSPPTCWMTARPVCTENGSK